MPNYTVKQGDCIENIAFRHGLFWEKVWNHPKNLNLKEKRKNPNVLFPGDVVFLPDKEEKQEPRSTEQRHRFKRKGVPTFLRIQVLDNDQIQANTNYTLEVEGRLFSGATDAQGKLRHAIPPNARRGKLIVGPQSLEYPLNLGGLDPITELVGIQERLHNLAYDVGNIDGTLNENTSLTLKQFQRKNGLPETGEPDEATRNKLEEVHGS